MGFANARNIFDQNVSFGDEGEDHQFDYFAFALDDGFNIADHAIEMLPENVDPCGVCLIQERSVSEFASGDSTPRSAIWELACRAGYESGSIKLTTWLGLPSHIGALLRRPTLFWEAVLSTWALRRHGRPYLSRAYLDWRLQTAYGTTFVSMPSTDLVHYLEWQKQMRRIRLWGLAR